MRGLLIPLLVVAALAGSASGARIAGDTRGEPIRGTARPDRIAASAGNERIDVSFGGTDSVSCGPGNDLVVADGIDRVAADCTTVVRRISVDPFHDSRAQHETAVEPGSAAWGSTVLAAFQLGRFRGGGAAGIGFALSHDAGRTWQGGSLPALTVASTPPGDQSRASDPAVAYDAAHEVWLIATLTIAKDSSVAVSRSADGLHWAAPVRVASGPVLDKEWIACDNGQSSPFRGRCYVVYTDDALHRMVSQTSTDGGRSWSAPVRVSTDLLGAQPLVRPDGSVVVLGADLPPRQRSSILAFSSSDGGATFSSGVVVTSFLWHQPRGMRSVPLPSGAVAGDGTLYAAWQQCDPGGACRANDIVVSSSADGTTWKGPERVTRGGTDHFVTGLGADPSRPGRLGLVYELFQPGSCAAGACLLGTAFTSSTDGGATWAPPLRLDAAPSPLPWLAESSGRMVGDYFSTSFAAGRAVPVFALAEPPLGGRRREAIFATSLRVR